MKSLLLLFLALSTSLAAQTTCTNLAAGTIASITCSDGSSATVQRTYQFPTLGGTVTGYDVTLQAPPRVAVPAVPSVQPIPLPALTVAPPAPAPNMNLMIYAAMVASNRPPSARQIRGYCKRHHGQTWAKRNWQGIIVAQGYCQ